MKKTRSNWTFPIQARGKNKGNCERTSAPGGSRKKGERGGRKERKCLFFPTLSTLLLFFSLSRTNSFVRSARLERNRLLRGLSLTCSESDTQRLHIRNASVKFSRIEFLKCKLKYEKYVRVSVLSWTVFLFRYRYQAVYNLADNTQKLEKCCRKIKSNQRAFEQATETCKQCKRELKLAI